MMRTVAKPNRVIGCTAGANLLGLLGSLGNSNHRPYRRPGLSKIEPVPWPRAPNPHFRQPIVALPPGTKKVTAFCHAGRRCSFSRYLPSVDIASHGYTPISNRRCCELRCHNAKSKSVNWLYGVPRSLTGRNIEKSSIIDQRVRTA